MIESVFTVTENHRLTEGVYRMTLAGDGESITAPGQFVNIRLDGHFLRRPISVYDANQDQLRIIYKVVGEGTAQMRSFQPGRELNLLSGLGNGFDLSCAGDAPLLLGGGVGVPPMYFLAKKLIEAGKQVRCILGFNTKDEVFCEAEFCALGASVTVATADGSYGTKGFVSDVLPSEYSYYYACGPEPMLKAVYQAATSDGQLSFAERMGCGFGACMGCSCKTVTGYKRICKDGPVLRKGEILWER